MKESDASQTASAFCVALAICALASLPLNATPPVNSCYDATGMWRDRQNGEGMRGDKGSPQIDVSGRMPGGREFLTVQEFKQALLGEKEAFLKGFTEQLLCYALGRPIGYADHLSVEEITAHAAKNNYRMQGIIQATVASNFFQTQ